MGFPYFTNYVTTIDRSKLMSRINFRTILDKNTIPILIYLILNLQFIDIVTALIALSLIRAFPLGFQGRKKNKDSSKSMKRKSKISTKKGRNSRSNWRPNWRKSKPAFWKPCNNSTNCTLNFSWKRSKRKWSSRTRKWRFCDWGKCC